MANEKIEIDIVLADGSVGKAFANISKAAEDATAKTNSALKSTEAELENYRRSIKSSTDFFNSTFRENLKTVDALTRKLREADVQATFGSKSFKPSETIVAKIAEANSTALDSITRKAREADLNAVFGNLPQQSSSIANAASSISSGFRAADTSFINFQKNVKSGIGNLFSLRNALITAAAGAGLFVVFRKVTGFIGDAVSEAQAGEKNINNLGIALKNAGEFSLEAVQGFKEFAERIEATTAVSKDQVISLSALGRNYTKTNEEAKKLTLATIQLSAANGKDLNTNLEFLGGTLQGLSGRIGKTIPGFRGLTEESLKSGAAVDLVLKRFGGSAESQVNTFSGAIERAKNQFNSFLGDLGNQIIRNPTVVAAFKGIGEFFNQVLGDVKGSTSGFKEVIDNIVLFGVDGFVLLARSIANAQNNIDGLKLSITSVIVTLLKGNQLILDFDLAVAKLDKTLSFGSDSSKAYLEESKRLSAQNKKSITDFENLGVSIAENQIASENRFSSLTQAAEDFRNKVIEASKVNGLLPEALPSPDGSPLPPSGEVQKASDEFIKYQQELAKTKFEAILLRDELTKLAEQDTFGGFEEQINKLKTSMEIANLETVGQAQLAKTQIEEVKNSLVDNAKQIESALNTGFTNAISSSITTLVSSIAAGENAFKAFASNLLGVIGDLAQQIGTFIIAAGVAKLQLFSGNPVSTIAAGAALVAIGAALSAISKKGSKGGFAAAAPGSSLTPPLTPAQPISDNIERQQQANIVINGDLLDADSTGLRIANILKDQGFANAVIA